MTPEEEITYLRGKIETLIRLEIEDAIKWREYWNERIKQLEYRLSLQVKP